ncbi:endonuclease [Polaribacter tangerinus]|uniref:endonuclease n=1 Tax=Polaribacter tangerinus TaxID=1920034 RepID=UPI000B4B70A5|nr:endonuclease [Polaribacter tangerinus]
MKKIFLAISAITSFCSFSQHESYYNNVNLQLTGLALKNELATKITSSHSNFLTYTPDVWIASKATDKNPNNNAEVILIYGYENGTDSDLSNDRERGINNNGGAIFNWNREHVFPKSLGNPNLGNVGPGADAHHLRPADASRNSLRSNRKFGRGSGNSGLSTIDFYPGLDGPNTAAWYPGDEWKGDVARMIMYMYLRYGNVCLPSSVGIGDSSKTPDDMIDLFLNWNVEDPVSEFEKARNNYHENTSNPSAQGNRNPFIDNPFLATLIWGGDGAEDTWGIYTSKDNEAPTTPTNVTVNNIDFSSFNITWLAATDNVGVTGYDVFINNTLALKTTTTSATISNLSPGTQYSVQILAKDLVNNKSQKSSPLITQTLKDTEAPTKPTNIIIRNITDTSFTITWQASTDNHKVDSYSVYINNVLSRKVTNTSYTVTNLQPNTNYNCQILATDMSNNNSELSQTITTKTVAGTSGVATSLFISEYVEGSGNNKAIEIVNLTGKTVNLNSYNLRRNPGGGNSWSDAFYLNSGNIKNILPNDVFVVTHPNASATKLVTESDLQTNAAVDNGAPLSFNGDDPVGLFKGNNLIDIVGEFNANKGDFAKNITLRRKSNITGPTTSFNLENDWVTFTTDTYDGIGNHNFSLSNTNNELINFKYYPNPVKGNFLHIDTKETLNIEIYSTIYKLVKKETLDNSRNRINIENLSPGIYLLKAFSNRKQTTVKFMKL